MISGRCSYPPVLKLPDECSGQGVFKADRHADMARITRPMLDASHLIATQETRPADRAEDLPLVEQNARAALQVADHA